MEIPNKPELIFGNNLRYLRKKNGLSLDTMGEIIGVKKSMVANYETGLSEPSLLKLIVVSHHFGVPIDDLLTKDISGNNGELAGETDSQTVRRMMSQMAEMTVKVGKMEAMMRQESKKLQKSGKPPTPNTTPKPTPNSKRKD